MAAAPAARIDGHARTLPSTHDRFSARLVREYRSQSLDLSVYTFQSSLRGTQLRALQLRLLECGKG
eukprot:2728098-Prymnesium_polylepis.1